MKKSQNTMRAKVLEFLRSLPKGRADQFNEAFTLYRNTEGKSIYSERAFNSGYSDTNLKNLLYELQKVHGITDVEVHRKERATAELNLDENLDVPNPLMADGKIIPTLETVEEIEAKKLIGEETADNQANFLAAPGTEERKTMRDEFPLLADKDCPNELKVLVADKITLYQQYVSDQNDLQAHRNGKLELTDEQSTDLAKRVLENFEANREIYEELNYYAANKKILGKHLIFEQMNVDAEINAMTQDQLVAYVNSSKKYFSVKKTALEEEGITAERKAKLKAAVKERKAKLALVEKRLGINE